MGGRYGTGKTMKITAKTEYACLAAVELARHYGEEDPVAVAEIAKKHQLSERFLVQILTLFKKVGLVTSKRGSLGGYYLAYRPEYLTLGYIMALVSDPVDPEDESDSQSDELSVLRRVWTSAEQKRQEFLNQTTLADLIRQSDEFKIVNYDI